MEYTSLFLGRIQLTKQRQQMTIQGKSFPTDTLQRRQVGQEQMDQGDGLGRGFVKAASKLFMAQFGAPRQLAMWEGIH